jgi:hypothetical protein
MEPVPESNVFGTCAVIWVDETKVELRAKLFHSTVSPCAKFLPVTVRVKLGPPAITVAGLTPVTTGWPDAGVGPVSGPPPSVPWKDGPPQPDRVIEPDRARTPISKAGARTLLQPEQEPRLQRLATSNPRVRIRLSLTASGEAGDTIADIRKTPQV